MKTILLTSFLLCLTLRTPGWADTAVYYCGSGPVPPGLIDGKCSVSSGLAGGQLAHLPMSPSITPQMDINGALILTPKQMAELKEAMRRDDGSTLRVTLVDDPCLAMMEAAMRQMEPFLYSESAAVESPESKTRSGFYAAMRPAFQQWDAAKKACWKETK